MFFNYRYGVGGLVVSDVDGEYYYDYKYFVFEWQLLVIDILNKSGSMEFSIVGYFGDFFFVLVSFLLIKLYCDFKVIYFLQYF